MTALLLTLTALISYFFGSISTPILTSNLYFHSNIRKYGLDNPGITRFTRRYGYKGYIVLFGTEIVKTLVPVLIGHFLMLIVDHADIGRAFALFCVILGTNFPVMYRFKGEHSLVAFIVGIAAVRFELALAFVAALAAVYFVTRYISLAVLSASLFMSVVTIMTIDTDIVRYLLFLSVLLVFIEYRRNIVNLIKGKEQKFIYRKDISYMFDQNDY